MAAKRLTAAEGLQGMALAWGRRGNGVAAEGTQHDADHERVGRELPVLDAHPGADRLQGHVDGPGQPGRVRWLDDLVVSGPQRQPRGTPGRGILQRGQQGAARYELLARGGALPRDERR